MRTILGRSLTPLNVKSSGGRRTADQTFCRCDENSRRNVQNVPADSWEGPTKVVADKGYHSNQVMVDLEAVGLRSYIAEPDRGRRRWTAQPEARDAVYRNRRRIRGARGRRLLRQRGERLERPFAHLYRTGRLRRVYLRGQANILKRVLMQAGACNLGLLLRTWFGVGTPRGLQGRLTGVTLLVAVSSLAHQALTVLRHLNVPPVHWLDDDWRILPARSSHRP